MTVVHAAPVAPTLQSNGRAAGSATQQDAENGALVVCVTGGVTHALKAEGADASEDGTGRGTPIIAFTAKDYGADAMDDCAPTLRAGGHNESHANAGVMPAIAFHPRQHPISLAELSPTLETAPMAVALRGRDGGGTAELSEVPSALRASTGGGDKAHVLMESEVRRLMPVECERLQGFPDGHTDIPYRNGRAEDGPRYKAIGNSKAIPVVRWIGQRIERAIMRAR